jgi:hypothetical protein
MHTDLSPWRRDTRRAARAPGATLGRTESRSRGRDRFFGIAWEMFPSGFRNLPGRFSFARVANEFPVCVVAEPKTQMDQRSRTIPFRATDESRITDWDRQLTSLADGTYRVLATLDADGRVYRVFADLNVSDGSAQLRLFRFELPQADEWFAERKLTLSVARPEIRRLEQKIGDAEFVLCSPVRLDAAECEALFGPSGPPVT